MSCCFNCNCIIPYFGYFRPDIRIKNYTSDFGECSVCNSQYCSNCIYKNEVINDKDKNIRKININAYLGDGYNDLIEAIAPINNDDLFEYSRYCYKCETNTLFTFYSYKSKCFRCFKLFTDNYDDIKGCKYHPGDHELPIDEDGRVCYPIRITKINNEKHHSLHLHPGRWNCCGSVCYHDNPQCPFHPGYGIKDYKYGYYINSNRIPGEDNINEIGCTNCEHYNPKIDFLKSKPELKKLEKLSLNSSKISLKPPIRYPSLNLLLFEYELEINDIKY